MVTEYWGYQRPLDRNGDCGSWRNSWNQWGLKLPPSIPKSNSLKVTMSILEPSASISRVIDGRDSGLVLCTSLLLKCWTPINFQRSWWLRTITRSLRSKLSWRNCWLPIQSGDRSLETCSFSPEIPKMLARPKSWKRLTMSIWAVPSSWLSVL